MTINVSVFVINENSINNNNSSSSSIIIIRIIITSFMTNTVFSLAGLRRPLQPLRPLAQPFSRSQGLGVLGSL